MTIRKTRALSFICLLLFLATGHLSAHPPEASRKVYAKNGVLDLRQENFSEILAISGEFKCYWHQLLKPGDEPKSMPFNVNFPGIWNLYPQNKGKKNPGFGYATYSLMLLLTPGERELRLGMPDAYSAYTLYINGELAAANGKVSTSPEDFEPHWQYRYTDLPRRTDTIRLLIQVANFSHHKGGFKDEITIGNRKKMELVRQRDGAVDVFLTGCLFMGGLFFLGLYLRGSRDKAILLFSLYSIVFSYRIAGVDNYVLHTIFPDLSWYFAIRLEYLSLFLGVSLFALYTRYLYPSVVSPLAVGLVTILCAAFALCSLLMPPVWFSQLINPFLVVMVFCIVYTSYIYIKAFRRRLPGAVYALWSSVALMGVFAISLLHYWGITHALQVLNFMSYIGFFFLQSMVLSHRVSFVLKKAQLEAEQGLKIKSEFLSNMSHEIRTPLNSVIGISHILLENNPREDQARQLEIMLFSANHLLTIVNDILDYNKIEAGKVRFEHIEMDIASVASNVVTGLQAEAGKKQLELYLQLDEALKNKVTGDPTRMFQVLNNLVHNAIKFTHAGSVGLIVKVLRETGQHVSLRFAVKDTGIGISEAHQKIIFERFTQADSSTSRGFGGTGLGLAICKRILELQESELKLNSSPGKGSTFYFDLTFEKHLSVVPVAPEKQRQLPRKDEKPLEGIHILLVEDNPVNVMVARNFLRSWGAGVDVAENGEQALALLDTSRHRLVLMDLHMPVMDGYESARLMRASGIRLPIIALTANLPGEVSGEVYAAGMDDMVVKPFLPAVLYNKVWNYVFPD